MRTSALCECCVLLEFIHCVRLAFMQDLGNGFIYVAQNSFCYFVLHRYQKSCLAMLIVASLGEEYFQQTSCDHDSNANFHDNHRNPEPDQASFSRIVRIEGLEGVVE